MTRHGIITQARKQACTVCHVPPPGLCCCCPDGVHMCRVCRAANDGDITYLDLATVMDEAGIHDGRTLLLDVVA